ncbi:MAG: hypothetical protein AAGJ52_09185 [Pseudomonadota bacterium]
MPNAASLMDIPGLHWHDYGKLARPGRKVGHATLNVDSTEALADGIAALRERLPAGWSAWLDQAEAMFA